MKQNSELAARLDRTASTPNWRESTPLSQLNSTTFPRANQRGFTKAPNCLLYEASLSIGSRLLLIVLLMFARRKKVCFPSQRTLSRIMGVDPRSIRRFLKELQERGLIQIERRSGRSNLYHICIDVDKYGPNSPDKNCGQPPADLSGTRDNGGLKRRSKEAELSVIRLNSKPDGKNKDVFELLINSAVNEDIAIHISSQPYATFEYVRKHLKFAQVRCESIGLAIHRMKCGDKIPNICLECGKQNGNHVLDCIVQRRRYLDHEF